MAQVNAGFVTGARALIKIAGKTMAYASDISYNITVQTIPIETMGKYEVHTNEPVAYNVDGSFSVVRYTSRSSETSSIKDQAAAGNGPNTGGGSTAPNSHLNPSLLLASSSFDIEIKEKGPDKGTASSTDETTNTVTPASGGDDLPVIRINDCRITRRGASLNKRGVLVDNFAFVAVLAGDADTDGAVAVGNSSMSQGGDQT